MRTKRTVNPCARNSCNANPCLGLFTDHNYLFLLASAFFSDRLALINAARSPVTFLLSSLLPSSSRHRSFPGAVKNCARKFPRVGRTRTAPLFAAECRRKVKSLASFARARSREVIAKMTRGRPTHLSRTSRRCKVSPGKLRKKATRYFILRFFRLLLIVRVYPS